MSNSWTFGGSGQYTATWDGVSLLTVTLTSGGTFLESFQAQSLNQALASPNYVNLLQAPVPSLTSGLQLVATAGINGFVLQNATPTILSWTAPSDGQLHRVTVFGEVDVSSGETGGAVSLNYKDPAGTSNSTSLQAGTAGTGVQSLNAKLAIVPAGQPVTVVQTSALTAGAATLWAEIWAS